MMSSDEEDRYNDQEATEEMSSDNENATMNNELDNLSRTSDVNLEINDVERDDTESSVARHQHEAEGKIGAEELPHSGNTESFKTKFESTATEEEQRAERRRERRRRRKLTKEEDGPSEGTTMSTADKFEKGEIDDMHYQKTDVTHDAMATVGTVSATTARFRSGHVSHSSDDDAQNKKNDGDDKAVVETGTAASRRKALEEYAEEARKSKTTNLKVLEEDEAVISPGSAASTRAKLERMSSEEKVLEKEIDTPSRPKRGTAAERRAKFEEKARQSSSDGGSRQATWVKRQSKWPEPKTNYRQRRAQLRTSASTDDETATDTVEMENAKNIEKSKEQELCNFEEPAKQVSGRQSSSEEEPKSPVKTADIRRKLVKMLSDEEKEPSQPVDRIGNARPSSGMARNLRARFEAGDTKQEESHFTGKQPSISSRSGYASRVRERFETGEVAKRRTSSTASEEDGVDHDTAARRRRTSSSRSVEGEAIMMSCTAKELRSRFENSSQNTTQVKRNFVLRPKGNASAISSRFNKTAPASNKCTNCTKTVYPVEMITADDKPFHKFCFKCTECKATLRLGNYAALQGQIYCKPHFKQLFKKKGNYDEGFGRQQHKKQWEEKAKTEDGDSKKFQKSDLNAKNTREVGDDLSRDLLNGEDERNDVTVEHTNGYITLNHEQRFSADEIEA